MSQRVTTLSALRSASAWTDVALTAFALAAVLSAAHRVVPQAALTLSAVWLACFIASFLALKARRTALNYVSRQPFRVDGYEAALHHPAHVLQNPMDTPGRQTVTLTIEFAKAHPSSVELTNALTSAVKPPHERLRVEGARVVQVHVSGGTHVQGHRRWFVRFMRQFADTMRTMHTTCPVLSVRIEPD